MARTQKHAVELLFCPHCGGEARVIDFGISSRYRYCVACENTLCGCRTPGLHLRAIAIGIWNKRVSRKPAKRVAAGRIPSLTPGADRGILRPAKRRSSASGSAAGKSVTAPKGAQLKHKGVLS